MENSNEGRCLLIAVIYFQKKDECVKYFCVTQMQRCIQPVAETYFPHSDISDALIKARSMQFVKVIHHLFIYLFIYFC